MPARALGERGTRKDCASMWLQSDSARSSLNASNGEAGTMASPDGEDKEEEIVMMVRRIALTRTRRRTRRVHTSHQRRGTKGFLDGYRPRVT